MHGEYLDWVPLYIGLRLRSVILHSWLYWVCTSKILITCGHAKWGSLIVIWKGLFLLTKINHWEEWVGKWRDILLPMRMLDEWWWLVWNYGLLTFVFIYFCCCWENVTFVFEFEYAFIAIWCEKSCLQVATVGLFIIGDCTSYTLHGASFLMSASLNNVLIMCFEWTPNAITCLYSDILISIIHLCSNKLMN